jgi:toxin CcdB
MAQFDVFRYARPKEEGILVVDVQHALFEGLATRLVVPLYPLTRGDKPIKRLNPIVEIDGKRYVLAVQEMAAVRSAMLRRKVTSLVERRDEIVAAIDFLTTAI